MAKRFATKLERISQLEQLLLAYPEGLSQAEIARRLQVHRSTVHRYLADITSYLPVFENGTKIAIDRDSYLNNVRLTVHEIMVLHLATRLFLNHIDKISPHGYTALLKLGNCLHHYSQTLSDFILATAKALEQRKSQADPIFIKVLEDLTRAWSDGLWLRLDYFSRQSAEIHTYDFAPYFVEPYAAGLSLYTVGYCKQKERIITLKVEHIRKTDLMSERYTIPPSFSPARLFKKAWGIWFGESSPQKVSLKFSPQVATRVAETCWHQSEQKTRLADGSIKWEAEIAEPLEMLPWIRGWGADCEVLEPQELRKLLADEARRLGQIYGDA